MNRLLIILLFIYMPALEAHEVYVPLQLDQNFLQRMLREQVYTENEAEARVWDDGKNCNYLVLSSPETRILSGQLQTRTRASARAGTVVGNTCISFIKWNGFFEIFQVPVLSSTPDVVEFEVTDSKIYSDDGESEGIIGTLWDWIKNYVHPRFNRVRLDVFPVINDLKSTLSLVFTSHPENIIRIIDSVVLANVSLDEEFIRIGIQFQVPDHSGSIKQNQPEPALTPEELALWEKNWQNWDAFLTQIIKKAGADTDLYQMRIALLSVLLDARQDLVEILAPATPGSEDPVPALFVKSWEQLAPVLQQVSENLPSSSVFKYLSFMTAANALAAIKSIEADTGFSITPDALRRMARIILPASTSDPLYFDTEIDTEMRELFGFGPLPSPPEVDPSTIEFPEQDNLLQENHWLNNPVTFSGGMPAALVMIFMPVLATGGNAYNLLVSRLNGRVPTINTLNEYLPMVQLLLELVSQSTIQQKHLDTQYQEIFRPLVLTTAWQESCWRQFINVNGEILPIKSSAGAVGIMQINQYVWRGFYDIKNLQNDVGYNAIAGSEILHHYLVDYAISKGEHELEGGAENLARATYAMYNGGPKQISRYRINQTPKSLQAIDNAFWKKFEIIRSGKTLAVSRCFTG